MNGRRYRILVAIILAQAVACSKGPAAADRPSAEDLEIARRLLADRNQAWWNGHSLLSAGDPPKIKMAEAGDWAAMNYNPPGTPVLPIVLARVLHARSALQKGSPFDGRPAVFLDVRNASDYYVEHIPGSRSVPVRDLKIPEDIDRTSVVIVTGELYPHHEVMARVRSGGFAVVYCLEGGMKSWRESSYPIEGSSDVKEYRRLLQAEREPGATGGASDFLGLGPLALKSMIDGGVEMKLVFVGDEETFRAGHIAGATRTTLNEIDSDFKDVPKDKLVAVYCGCCAGRAGGYSEAAARKLRQMGYTRVLHLDGHLGAWREAGYPIVPASTK